MIRKIELFLRVLKSTKTLKLKGITQLDQSIFESGRAQVCGGITLINYSIH